MAFNRLPGRIDETEDAIAALATALGSPADLTDDVGGSAGGTDAALIENIRVRLNEVVAVLTAIGLIDDQPDA